ncbi:MAG: formylglycine-generating enzyme family protein, partial [Rubripirellula sp.]|nr:formylglycine-generating enzyme family protein [Rubripirellula sp.]
DTASQRQIAFVRTYALGEYAEHSQALLNELATARSILLNPAEKAKYDAKLKAQQQQSKVVPASPGSSTDVPHPGTIQIASAPAATRKTSRNQTRRQSSSKRVPLVAGVVGLLLIGGVVVWLLSGPKQAEVAERPSNELRSQDALAIQAADAVQPSRPPRDRGALPESVRPSEGDVAEQADQEIAKPTGELVDTETTTPPELEEAPSEMAVASSELPGATNATSPAVAPFDSASATKYQETWAQFLGVNVELGNSIGMKLRVIPPGDFMMGSGDRNDAAYAVHQVTLTEPFMLGVHEVTQSEYEKVMDENPSNFEGLRNPADNVSWGDANEFCRRLSLLPSEKLAGRAYRLPTEAEWEYACRAGTTTRYSCGDNESLFFSYGWSKRNSGGKTHPVGSKLPNPFGLYDMQGNVWEWCQDWFGDYPGVAVTNPTGASSGLKRVFRGGSWFLDAKRCRSAYRAAHPPSHRDSDFGFRVVCTIAQPDKNTAETDSAETDSAETKSQVVTSDSLEEKQAGVPETVASPSVPVPASNVPASDVPASDVPAIAVAPFDA